jgi:DNA-binding LacI/PurR family transcriptional regulator
MHQKTIDALNQLEKMILQGEVGVSGFLPPERDLCRQLNIGRGSLQAIINQLVEKNLVYKVPSKGIKILNRNEESSWKKFLVVIQGNTLNVTEQFELVRGVATAADERAAEIVLFFNHNDFADLRLNERLLDHNLDGIVFIEKFIPRVQEVLKDSSVPYVVANYESAALVPAIRVDYREVGRKAGRYLVEKGYKNIGFISNSLESYIYKEMYSGLKGALAEDDITPCKELSLEMDSSLSQEQRKEAIYNLLKQNSPKGAIFAGRDHIAKLIFECCEELNLRIPEDIAIIGNDNVSWSNADKAGLTSFEQPVFETGKLAINVLCDAIENKTPVESKYLSSKLVERSSV